MSTAVPRGVSRGAVRCLGAILAFSFLFPAARAQSGRQKRDYSRVNSFGAIIAYSNDSSHVLLGDAQQRKLREFGGSYNRRLGLGRPVSLQYSAEFLPVALESDPLSRFVDAQTEPTATTTVVSGDPPISSSVSSEEYSFPRSNGETFSGTAMLSCHRRRWTMGEAMSPIGMQWNFSPAYFAIYDSSDR